MPAFPVSMSNEHRLWGDPSHALKETQTEADEKLARWICKEPKVPKLRADGSQFTVHSSSATIRDSRRKEPNQLQLPSLEDAARRAPTDGDSVTLPTPTRVTFYPGTFEDWAVSRGIMPASAAPIVQSNAKKVEFEAAAAAEGERARCTFDRDHAQDKQVSTPDAKKTATAFKVVRTSMKDSTANFGENRSEREVKGKEEGMEEGKGKTGGKAGDGWVHVTSEEVEGEEDDWTLI